MYTIINDLVEKFKGDLTDFLVEDKKSIDEIEKYCLTSISNVVLSITAAYYEEIDEDIRTDKKKRKEDKIVVERLSEPRSILTKLGMLNYRRTYYKKTGTDDIGYIYPVDEIAGINSYQRMSNSIEKELVEHAIYESYQKSSNHVTQGFTSKQTVMNKIRESEPIYPVLKNKRIVPILHIDADEDHITLQNGKRTIVPMVSVYEGVTKSGKRGMCNNVFHISSYGKSIDEFWEDVLNTVEGIYDITDTKIYIHGDGANWIKRGKEWFPNNVFCLDRFHISKYCKLATANMCRHDCIKFQHEIMNALLNKTVYDLIAIQGEMISAYQDQYDGIMEATSYLINNFDAIKIYTKDKESLNGGATEPHISHVLSSRLSSRPMGWSKNTLEKFTPILASKSFILNNKKCINSKERFSRYSLFLNKKKKYMQNSLGLPDPDLSIGMACAGKSTPLLNSLLPFFGC